MDAQHVLHEEHAHWKELREHSPKPDLAPQIQFYDDAGRVIAFAMVSERQNLYAGCVIAAATDLPISLNADVVYRKYGPGEEAELAGVSLGQLADAANAGDERVHNAVMTTLWYEGEAPSLRSNFYRDGGAWQWDEPETVVPEAGIIIEAFKRGADHFEDPLSLDDALDLLARSDWHPFRFARADES